MEILTPEELTKICGNNCSAFDCTHTGCHAARCANAQLLKDQEHEKQNQLMICEPRTDCTTWDFCTRHKPHICDLACACNLCRPFIRKDYDQAVAAERTKVIAEIEEGVKNCGMLTHDATTKCHYADPVCKIFCASCSWWQQLKGGQ